jgi:hypothetical protein
MAVELLEAMDESIVAKKAAGLIKQSLSVVKISVVTNNAVESSIGFDNSHSGLFMPQSFDQNLTDTVCIIPIGRHILTSVSSP